MWTLQSVEPADADLTFRLLPGTLKTMGRAPRADFVVDAALVSRVHCRFTLRDTNELELEDLGSTNGTFVNGEKVTRATLSDGDKLTIGRVQFVVNAEVDAEASKGSERPGLRRSGRTCEVFEDERVRRLLTSDRRFRPVP